MAPSFPEVQNCQSLVRVHGEAVDMEEVFGTRISEYRASIDSVRYEKLMKKAMKSVVFSFHLNESDTNCYDFSTSSIIPFGLSISIETHVTILFTHVEEFLKENVCKTEDFSKLSLLARLTRRRISEYLSRFSSECNLGNILHFVLKVLDDAVITVVVDQIIVDPFDSHRMVFKCILKKLLKYLDDFGRKQIRRPSYFRDNRNMITKIRLPLLLDLSKKLERENNNSSQHCIRDLLS